MSERLNTEDLNRTVFISDNLSFLQRLDNESVDLVVIDPPFGKTQTFVGKLRPPLTDREFRIEREMMDSWSVYDVASAYEIGIEYPDQTGTTAKFEDIWNFRRLVFQDDLERLKQTHPAAWWLIHSTRYTHSDGTAAYIYFMVQRMVEIKRVLKLTGSVYLHCDHDANAYLRQMMDAVFGEERFLNAITWERTRGRSDGKHWGNVTDTILCYSKTENYVWHNTYLPSESSEKETHGDLTAAEVRNGISGQPWRNFNPTAVGRHWAVPKSSALAEWIDANRIPGYMNMADPRDRLEALDKAGMLTWSDNGRPSIVRPAESKLGAKLNNLWTDITRVSGQERTGYPTQKPQALAERIIKASSNPGDIVLDCFAGCAYVPVAAENARRRWIACDMSPRAWTIVRRQFHKHPDLGILTEGELDDDGVKVKFDNRDKVIRVRGPRELPQRTTLDSPIRIQITTLPEPEFRRKAFETYDAIWQAFVDEWGTRCWYCDTEKSADKRELQLDHIEPNTRDGRNDDCWNRALACAPCNSDKGNTLTVEETIDKALESGRIATSALRDEVLAGFNTRHNWAKERWEEIKPSTSRTQGVQKA